MGEEAGDWNQTCQEWLIDEQQCVAGGLAGLDGVLYAAAPVAGDEGWSLLFKDPYKQMMAQDDGTEKEEEINEAAILALIGEGKRPPKGLWIAGEKYTVTRQEEDEIDGNPVKVTVAGRPKKGLVIYVTSSSIVVGMYDESKVATQTIGNCRKAVHAFAEYLIGAGF
eukprot:SRR837773.2925.p2 GENE.SRR837773.2925~~SRR837773.2925.p2  ORF type:complete len:184 (-),score=95.57 SRR837773.2925:105-605(-)